MGNFPVGPLAGVAFNLTLLSYCGSLDMGLHLDPAAVAEPALLRTLLLDAFDELIDVASLTPAQRPATTSRRSTSKATGEDRGQEEGEVGDEERLEVEGQGRGEAAGQGQEGQVGAGQEPGAGRGGSS